MMVAKRAAEPAAYLVVTWDNELLRKPGDLPRQLVFSARLIVGWDALGTLVTLKDRWVPSGLAFSSPRAASAYARFTIEQARDEALEARELQRVGLWPGSRTKKKQHEGKKEKQ